MPPVKIPEKLITDEYFIDMNNFSGSNGHKLYVDYFNQSEGSLLKYLSDNFSSYNTHKDNFEEFYSTSVEDLPSLKFGDDLNDEVLQTVRIS